MLRLLERITSARKLPLIVEEARVEREPFAAGILLELGLANMFEDAEIRAKSIRSIINIKPMQKQLLKEIY
ncbi:hypothetical protein [Paenibacillus illinoisensis]|uniref:Protein-tyrosine phosphatase n=1 Tax=Paenibacillus illinoisensis TaxID=59845 RepID=A0A2W0C1W0_9BACL|nr:hypothetical protein [Paenibacillus illinoisensis]PYY25866.1 Protein-tyrosine phosphatase [Paenibacillus illinoisensis]